MASQCSPRYRFSSFARLFAQVYLSHVNVPLDPALQSRGCVTKPIAISHAPPTAHHRPGSQRSRLRSHRSHDRMTGPGTRHPPPPGGRRALARVDAAPPLLAPTRSARLASGSGSFAGARLLLTVGCRSQLCPSRRAPRRARATSGAVSLRSTAPPSRSPWLAGRCGVLSIGDRSPTSPAPVGATSPGSLAGLSSRPRPSGRNHLAAPKAQRGGGSRAQRGTGVGSPSPENSGEQRSGSEPVQWQRPGRPYPPRTERRPPSGPAAIIRLHQKNVGARRVPLDWPPGSMPRPAGFLNPSLLSASTAQRSDCPSDLRDTWLIYHSDVIRPSG